jgi:ribonuclease HI
VETVEPRSSADRWLRSIDATGRSSEVCSASRNTILILLLFFLFFTLCPDYQTKGFSKAYAKNFKTEREGLEFLEGCRSGRIATDRRGEIRKEETIPTKTSFDSKEKSNPCKTVVKETTTKHFATDRRGEIRKEETIPTNTGFHSKEKSNPCKTVVKETTTKHESIETDGCSSTTTTSTTTTVTTTISRGKAGNEVDHCGKHERSVSEQTDENSGDEQQRHTKRRRRSVDAVISHSPQHSSSVPEKLKVEIQILFDGGSRGNPAGVGGAGAVVTVGGVWDSEDPPTAAFRSRSYHVRHFIGANISSNEAEYHGLLIGLLAAKHETRRLGQAMELTTINLNVRGDSNLVIEQLKGSYRCKDKKFIPLFNQANQELDALSSLGKCNVCLEHIYRDNNAKADGEFGDDRPNSVCSLYSAYLTLSLSFVFRPC